MVFSTPDFRRPLVGALLLMGGLLPIAPARAQTAALELTGQDAKTQTLTAADLARLPGAAEPHRARPAPGPGQVVLAGPDQWWLFWSLSFATTARDWHRAGGFCEDYRGYGGEDTDVAATVRSLGGSLFWVGGADAHHQHHAVESPPVRHLEAIVRNAAVFHGRWGWWPMTGWLERFRENGLVDYDAAADTWSLTAPVSAPASPADSPPDSAGDEAAASSTCS